MPRVPIIDSLVGPPNGLVRQIRRERELESELECLPRIFLVTALELDGNDLGPLINYTREKLYDEAEKHFNQRVLSKSNRSLSGHRHRCRVFLCKGCFFYFY